MPLLTLPDDDQEARLDHARSWLATTAPDLSAETLLTRRQKRLGLALALVVVVAVVLAPTSTATVLVAACTLVYVAVVSHRVAMTIGSLRHPNVLEVSDEEAQAVPDDELPIYTVLVPVFGEASVVPALVDQLQAIDYPPDRLDVKLLVEASDPDTLLALGSIPDPGFEVVVVPDGQPRTKPKALNYGLTLARGELVTIYDAEDRPDPLQLRRAVVAFGRVPSDVGCLQSQLAYWNADQNLLTRWFGVEYLQWFRLFLPGLAAGDAPVPLGGTSNHLRRSLLDALGAWDPYNVTEDADLGIRLHRCGYRSAVLGSVTWEEANSDYVNWNKQRSRWYKGYLQTWLVHIRHPRALVRDLGWRGFLEFNAFVGGTPILALLNLVFWTLTVVWFASHASFIEAIFPAVVFYPAIFCLVFGNVAVAYLFVVSAAASRQSRLVRAALLVPVYWVMQGIAAVKAVWQLAVDRSYWEKTVHGLAPEVGGAAGAAPPTGAAEVAGAVGPEAGSALAPAAGVPRALQVEQASLLHELGRSDRPARHPRSRLALVLRSGGLALLLVAAYVLFLSGIVVRAPGPGALRGAQTRSPRLGSVVAEVIVPRLHASQVVVEGTGTAQLDRAPGHALGSSLPGDRGTSVLVGHRVSAGGRFGFVAKLHVGDRVDVLVGGGTARYEVVEAGAHRGSTVAVRRGRPELVLVTGARGLDPGRLTVVRARLVSAAGVELRGARRPLVSAVTVPGADLAAALAALAWFLVAVLGVVGLQRLKGPLGRPIHGLVSVVLGGLVLWAMCAAAAHALPLGF